MPLAADSDGDVRTLHWFVDQGYVGSARSGAAPQLAGRNSRATFRSVSLTTAGAQTWRNLKIALLR